MEESCWNVYYALQRAVEYSPSSIRESTGFFLEELAKGLLQAILFSVAILVLSAGIGAVAGGILAGILSAGGTPVGVATGAEIGTDVGFVLLDWLGLGFLIVYVTQHIDRVTTLARRGVGIAWESGAKPGSQQAGGDRCRSPNPVSSYGRVLRPVVAGDPGVCDEGGWHQHS